MFFITEYIPAELDVRLINQEGDTTPGIVAGRVEIFYQGEWGSVCDDDWTDLSAVVVCRQLGLNTSSRSLTNGYYGESSGLIWLDNVKCTGSEEMLAECNHERWGQHDCLHIEDAGVQCNYYGKVLLL